MEVFLDWFSFKDPFSTSINTVIERLPDDDFSKLNNEGYAARLEDFYSVGHPTRWSETIPPFPDTLALNINGELSTQGVAKIPLSDLFKQVAGHIDTWRSGIQTYVDPWIDKEERDRSIQILTGGLNYLGKKTSDSVEIRYESTIPSSQVYSVSSISFLLT